MRRSRLLSTVSTSDSFLRRLSNSSLAASVVSWSGDSLRLSVGLATSGVVARAYRGVRVATNNGGRLAFCSRSAAFGGALPFSSRAMAVLPKLQSAAVRQSGLVWRYADQSRRLLRHHFSGR